MAASDKLVAKRDYVGHGCVAENGLSGFHEYPASRESERRDDAVTGVRLICREPVVDVIVAIRISRAGEAFLRLLASDRAEMGCCGD